MGERIRRSVLFEQSVMCKGWRRRHSACRRACRICIREGVQAEIEIGLVNNSATMTLTRPGLFLKTHNSTRQVFTKNYGTLPSFCTPHPGPVSTALERVFRAPSAGLHALSLPRFSTDTLQGLSIVMS